LQSPSSPLHHASGVIPQLPGADADDEPSGVDKIFEPLDVVCVFLGISPVVFTVVLDPDEVLGVAHVDPSAPHPYLSDRSQASAHKQQT
jgi:hypothetical protein